MKKLLAILTVMMFMVAFTNANLSKTAIKVHAKAKIGDWSDKEDFCPNKGDGCIHLPPIVIEL